jgi:hypothetical protein
MKIYSQRKYVTPLLFLTHELDIGRRSYLSVFVHTHKTVVYGDIVILLKIYQNLAEALLGSALALLRLGRIYFEL